MTEERDYINTSVTIPNLHCPSCIDYITSLLQLLSPAPLSVTGSVQDQIINIVHSHLIPPQDIIDILLEADFEVSNISQSPAFNTNEPIPESTTSEALATLLQSARRITLQRFSRRDSYKPISEKHLEHCIECQKDQIRKTSISPVIGTQPEILKNPMEHPSTNLAPQAGLKPRTFDMTVAIEGMTCSICSGQIVRTIEGLGDWILEANANNITDSGLVTFLATGNGKSQVDQILEEIDSLGYDAKLMKLTCRSSQGETSTRRSMKLSLSGIRDEAHVQRIGMDLSTSFDDAVQVDQLPSVGSEPSVMKITYTPAPPEVSIRKIIAVIAATDCKVGIHHDETMEESRLRIQKKKRWGYLIRLIVCVIIAIPTFLIGVLWMALVPKRNSTRMWFESPIWAGNASRIEWALLFLSTPVMFYCANQFHWRSIRDIMKMWGPKSQVPILERLYRFGSMNLLISLGVTVSYLSSVAMLAIAATRNPHHGEMKGHVSTYFDSTVFLTMFLLMGKFLESHTKSLAANDVSFLTKWRPREARLLEFSDDVSSSSHTKLEPVSPEIQDSNPSYPPRNVQILSVPVSHLEIGDLVLVRNGDTPPCDSILISGTTVFDESSISGESVPVYKAPGDILLAGTTNIGSPLHARITTIDGESMIDKILDAVRSGQNKNAPIERIAEHITSYFVPVICLLAVLTWLVWLGLGTTGKLPEDYKDINEGGWALWSLSFAIAVFVVACPCGIGLAAPCALHIGNGLAARLAILAKGGGEAFERAAGIQIMIFDKTGTLTQGSDMVVTDETIFWTGDDQQEKMYLIAKLLEEGSSHPLARAVVRYCEGKTQLQGRSIKMEEVAGKGSQGRIEIEGKIYRAVIGSENFLIEGGVVGIDEHQELLTEWKMAGKSVILMAIAEESEKSNNPMKLATIWATADPIREEAPMVVEGLKKMGVSVWMLSGDNAITAQAIARQVGIPETNVLAGLLPTEKADKIEYLQSLPHPKSKTSLILNRRDPNRTVVAFLGDGINDSPALRKADVGISVGSGSDIAQQTASFILITSNLNSLLTLISLSRAVVRRIMFNFAWACVFNLTAIPLAAGVAYPGKRLRLTPVWAALAMALSSVSVVTCSLLLRTEWWGVGYRAEKKTPRLGMAN
ncbi:Cu2+-exporting ATPase [Pyronema omphalodes]|nr:Cu2+-exporting ATPase [Pyronema omphalodes]